MFKFLLLPLFVGVVFAVDFSATPLKNYDGDTFTADINCSEQFFCKGVSVRVKGVDTPEMKSHTELSVTAKTTTTQFLQTKPITLVNCVKDKYFRIVCDVYNGNKQNLSDVLLKANLAKPYDGGTKEEWK